MITFEERLEIGTISEKKFESDCLRNGIEFVSTKKFNGWTPKFDSENGDYIVPFKIKNLLLRVDIKGGSISKHSIEVFKGDYFVIYETSNEKGINGLVFAASFLKTAISYFKLSNFDILPYSKDPGILFSRLKTLYVSDYNLMLKSVMTIEDFLKTFN